jgi:hypothetical protein
MGLGTKHQYSPGNVQATLEPVDTLATANASFEVMITDM